MSEFTPRTSRPGIEHATNKTSKGVFRRALRLRCDSAILNRTSRFQVKVAERAATPCGKVDRQKFSGKGTVPLFSWEETMTIKKPRDSQCSMTHYSDAAPIAIPVFKTSVQSARMPSSARSKEVWPHIVSPGLMGWGLACIHSSRLFKFGHLKHFCLCGLKGCRI